jgi:hypothetical protein
MRQTHQNPFGSGSSFSPHRKTPKAQMMFDPCESSFGTGLSALIEFAQQRRTKPLFHLATPLPHPVAPTLSTDVLSVRIGSTLRRAEHQYFSLGFDLRNFSGVVVTFIDQNHARFARLLRQCF